MRGAPWTESHTATLHKLAGRVPDAEIGRITGHCAETVARYRRAFGLKAHAPRANWTRRDWLLHDAAGLTLPQSVRYAMEGLPDLYSGFELKYT